MAPDILFTNLKDNLFRDENLFYFTLVLILVLVVKNLIAQRQKSEYTV